MPDNPSVSPINQEESGIHENDHTVTRGHIHIIVGYPRKAVNDYISNDAGNENDKNINGKNNPPWQVANVAESLS